MVKSRRRFLAALGTASALATTGCLSSSGDTPQSSSTTTGQTTTADLQYPDGFSTDGIDNVDQIFAGHREYLLGRDNYTEQWTLEQISASGEVSSGQPTEMTLRAAPTAEKLHLQYHDHANNIEVFYDGSFYEYDVAEETVSEGESPRLFANVEKQYQPLAFWAATLLLRSLLNTVRVNPTGTRTVAGTTAITFEVTSVSETRKEEVGDDVTFTGADGSVVVTESGGIHRFEYVPQFESDSTSLQTATFELTDIGTTEVSRPEWVPE